MEENEPEHIGLACIVENTMKNLHIEIRDLRQAFDESRSDCYHFQLLASARAQKIHKPGKPEGPELPFSMLKVEDLTLETKAVEQEATRWREACELEVKAGKSANKELNQERRTRKGKSRADLETASSKLKLKEKLPAIAMAAQAAADACLKLADRRSAGLQQRIEELMRQIDQEDAQRRKERGSTHSQKIKIYLLALAATSSYIIILSS